VGHMGLASACSGDLEKEIKNKTWKSELSPPVLFVPTVTSCVVCSRKLRVLATDLVPWAIRSGRNASCILNVYYEQRWEQPVESLREEIGIFPPPAIRV